MAIRKSREPFRAAYRDIEAGWMALAKCEGTLYTPNVEPAEPVDYVFICMEPSLDGLEEGVARANLEGGARNFLGGQPTLLHFAIRRYLLEPRQRYHITDVSKGGMKATKAGGDRTRRWNRWYPSLLAELDLVAKPGAELFAVGRGRRRPRRCGLRSS
jgi:hypothetical protein